MQIVLVVPGLLIFLVVVLSLIEDARPLYPYDQSFCKGREN